MPWTFADARYESHAFLEGPYARIPKELGCAFAASFLVSPMVSAIDKAMVHNIFGVTQIMRSMAESGSRMLLQPRTFLTSLSFQSTILVYFGTYAVANCSEAALDFYEIRDENRRKQWKVGLASTANVGLLSWRDSVFARAYTTNKPVPARTPLRTLGLFATRDTATMYSTFYVAPMVAEYLITEHDVNKEVANVSTALTVPVLSQFLTAPLHIHALDFFNRPNATLAERLTLMRSELGTVCLARGLRIFPAYGIGSYCNNKFRELTIRQPNEDLLLRRRVSRSIHDLSDKLHHRNELHCHQSQEVVATSTITSTSSHHRSST